MNAPLERAARALVRAKYGDTNDDYWQGMSGDEKSLYIAMVRAALMAVRKPDEAVTKVGLALDIELEWQEPGRAIPRVFTAMIDAILVEGET